MVQIWKVSWNKKLYDYKKLIQDFNNNHHSGIIFQSKGKAHMVNLPQVNDIVYVSCNKQHIITCTIISNFIHDGNEQNNDDYNLGNTERYHSDNNTYLSMRIDKIHNNPTSLKGCQRTWCKYKSP